MLVPAIFLLAGVLIMAWAIVAEHRPGLTRAERIAEMIGDALDAFVMMVIAALAGLTIGGVLFGCTLRFERPRPAWSGVPAIEVPFNDAPERRLYDGGSQP